MSSYLEFQGKRYNEGFLKRCKCVVCGDSAIRLESWFYRVDLEGIETLDHTKNLPAGYFSDFEEGYNFMCWGCAHELFQEYYEFIKKIERCFPK